MAGACNGNKTYVEPGSRIWEAPAARQASSLGIQGILDEVSVSTLFWQHAAKLLIKLLIVDLGFDVPYGRSDTCVRVPNESTSSEAAGSRNFVYLLS